MTPDRIPLYNKTVPYEEMSPDQAAPSLESFVFSGSRGAVVVAPGGGYVRKAPHEGPAYARMLKDAGISAFVLDYRVNPCHCMAPLADMQRAVRTVRSLGYEKVAVMGSSAGGHLACTAAVRYDRGIPGSPDPIDHFSCRPDALISCYSVVSFGPFAHEGSRRALLGDRAEDPDLIDHFSAEKHVTPDTPPSFLWHTADDGSVPCENSLLLAGALSANRVPFELHIFPHGPHGLGLAAEYPDVSIWASLCVRWLLSQGFGI